MQQLASHTSTTLSVEPIEPVFKADIDWVGSIPFLIVHVLAVAGLFYFPISLKNLGLVAGFYFIHMFGITAGYHRYFSHRTFKTSRTFQFILAWIAGMSAQKGVLWWAAHHRHHHRVSDQKEDVHSPVQNGFWFSHVGWILARKNAVTHLDRVRDLAKFPELVWLSRYFLVPVVVYAIITYIIGGWTTFFWAFIVATTLAWHGTFTVNSLTHVFGSKRFESNDESRNNFLIALFTMGEGWHNNHHYYMNSTRQGFRWWEIDPTYYILKILSVFGIVWDIREPPTEYLK